MNNSFAIVIPVYDNANQFYECMASIENQIFRDFDVHIFDDASADNYEKVLAGFTHLKVIYHRNEKNIGALKNIANAYNSFSGSYKYILLMHEDDLLHPQFMEAVAGAINKGSDLSFVMSKFAEFSGNESYSFFTQKITATITETISKEELCSQFLEMKPLAFGSVVYNTDIFKDMNLDEEQFAEFADRPFLLKGMKNNLPVIVIDTPLYGYRSHGINDNRWKKLQPSNVFALLAFYRSILQPHSSSEKKMFKKNATAFIFESVRNLKLANSFPGFIPYLFGALNRNYLSFKYALLRINIINKAGSAIKNNFN